MVIKMNEELQREITPQEFEQMKNNFGYNENEIEIENSDEKTIEEDNKHLDVSAWQRILKKMEE